MTRLKYLEKQRDMAYHNLMCLSGNASMTVASPDSEKEWQQAKAECRIVEDLILMVKDTPRDEVVGAAVINGKVVHNWQEVLGAVKSVAAL